MPARICGYSLTELEPRLFSFNNPVGACPTCDGLGVKQFFDPQRIVHDPNLSLAKVRFAVGISGIIIIFNCYYRLAKHYNFDIETAF